MNYIRFGGSGFIGTHLIHLLLKECVRPGDVIYDLDLVMPGEEEMCIRDKYSPLYHSVRRSNVFVCS